MNNLEQNYATLGNRLRAWLIDISPCFIIALIFGAASIVEALSQPGIPPSYFITIMTGTTSKAIATILIVIYPFYLVFLEGSKQQATFGKRFCNIYVVKKSNGERIGYIRAFFRYFLNMFFLHFYIGLAGYIYAAFNKEKATLHNLITATRVINGRPIN